MKKIKKIRFDALAGYIRNSGTQLIGKELQWYEEKNILGLIFFDYTDKLYNTIILGQDENLKYRCIDIACDFHSKHLAEKDIQKKITYWIKQPRNAFFQGDGQKGGLDFLKPLFPKEKLNDYFKLLVFDKTYLPANQLISYLMRYYETDDVKPVNQFQREGFHSRLWELYLYAMLSENNFLFEKTNKIDFLCENLNGKIAIEATAINPEEPNKLFNNTPYSKCKSIQEVHEENDKQFDHRCIKISKVLMRKLRKKYWEQFNDIPLIIAIQDFHAPFSSQTLVPHMMSFLYGEKLVEKSKIYKLINISDHKYQNRRIKSNFFKAPGSEYISAVMCNTQATLPKFNRIGIVAGFKPSDDISIQRSINFIENGDLSKIKNVNLDVKHDNYFETWSEGLNIFHNPNAKVPLDPDIFPNTFHYYVDRDSIYPSLYILNSTSLRLEK